MGDRWGLNPQPLEPQSSALPIELRSPWLRCALGGIRTHNLGLRRSLLYPDELRAPAVRVYHRAQKGCNRDSGSPGPAQPSLGHGPAVAA